MGLFDKLKNILFEEDEEEYDTSIPTFTKEDIKKKQVETKTIEKEEIKQKVIEEPKINKINNEDIKLNDSGHFTNVKRDIDNYFTDEDVLSEIPGSKDVFAPKRQVTPEFEIPKPKVEIPKPVVEEKKTVFQTFDEEEFERINSHHTNRENNVRREIPKPPMKQARIANNNFSSTMSSKELEEKVNKDRYKIEPRGKKPFSPSPVISPVYGILDKNYTKDSIVDKTDGMKREKIERPVQRVELQSQVKETKEVDVDIDSIRNKAFGELEDLEESYLKERQAKKEEQKNIVEKTPEIIEPDIEEIVEEDDSQTLLDDLAQEHFEDNDLPIDDIDVSLEASTPKELDDLEKTSTLQILDDIEKELNSIKPVQDKVKNENVEEPKEEGSLEDDLYDLIDSMYEENEDEEDKDD